MERKSHNLTRTRDKEWKFPPTCLICASKDRNAVEDELFLDYNIERVANKYSITFKDVQKHVLKHMTEKLIAKVKEVGFQNMVSDEPYKQKDS